MLASISMLEGCFNEILSTCARLYIVYHCILIPHSNNSRAYCYIALPQSFVCVTMLVPLRNIIMVCTFKGNAYDAVAN